MMNPRYSFANVKNIRDLGGLRTNDGRVTRYHAFVRSDLPNEVSEDERLQLLENGIRTAVDLRFSVTDKINILSTDPRFTYLVRPLFVDKFPVPENPGEFPVQYIGIMNDNRERIREIIHTLATAEGGVLYHCAAGKDRTGIISMLLLSVAGVPEETIVWDYGLSYYNLIGRVGPEAEAAFKAVPYPALMRRTLALLRTEFGSPLQYLEEIGVTEEEREAIYRKLVG